MSKSVVRWVASEWMDEIAWAEVEAKEQRNGWLISRILRSSNGRTDGNSHAGSRHRVRVGRTFATLDEALARVCADAWDDADDAKKRATRAVARAEEVQRMAAKVVRP